MSNIQEEVGELKGKVAVWIENVKTQFENIKEQLLILYKRTENIQEDLSEIKINVAYLKNNLSRGFWEKFFTFAQTPKGGLAIIIIIIISSAVCIGADKIITMLEILAKTR